MFKIKLVEFVVVRCEVVRHPVAPPRAQVVVVSHKAERFWLCAVKQPGWSLAELWTIYNSPTKGYCIYAGDSPHGPQVANAKTFEEALRLLETIE